MLADGVDPGLPQLRGSLGWSTALGVLLIVAGLLAILMPVISGIAVAVVTGWLLLLGSLFHFLLAWKTHTTRGVVWEILLAILYGFSGVYLILHPLAGLASLTLLLIAYFLIKGIAEAVFYFRLHPRHGAGWLLLDAIVNLALALMVWFSWPFSATWAIGTLVGIGLLFTGVSRLMVTQTVRRSRVILLP